MEPAPGIPPLTCCVPTDRFPCSDGARARLGTMSDVIVTHNPEQRRYEAHLEGALAGFAEYQLTDELVVFTHTEVDPSFEGRGVGSALARFGLDDVRAQGTREVMPLCPFIKAWIGKRPDYIPLVYGAPTSTARD